MIKELWHWTWMLLSHLLTFRWSHLAYHWQNLWWYIWKGFTYYDVQDTDDYILQRLHKMLIEFKKYYVGIPDELTEIQYRNIIDRMIYLTDVLSSDKFADYDWAQQIVMRKELSALLQEYFYSLWF